MGQSIPDRYTVRLRRGVTLSGLVLNEDNQPVAGAEVHASIGINEALKEQAYLSQSTCVTDANGHWAIHDYSSRPAASQYASLELSHPDYVVDQWQGILPHFDDLLAGTHVLKVNRGLVLAGQVIDGVGDPILGATVSEGYDLRFGHEPLIQTDGEGRFKRGRLQAGKKIVTVTAPSYAPDMRVLDFPTSREDEVFVLEPGQVLRFEVTDPNGRPLRGARVQTHAWRAYSPMQRAMNLNCQGKTNAKGATTLTDLPVDEVVFHVTKKGYAGLEHVLAKPADGKVQVVLWPCGEVAGGILNRQTGKTIQEADLIEGPQWPDREAPVWQSTRPRHLSDGHYRYVFKVHDQGMALRVEAAGFLPEETDVFYNDGTHVERDIWLTPCSGITGVVLDPEGHPANAATVVVAHTPRPAYLKGGRLRVEPGEDHVETDWQGRFSFPPQRQTYWLFAVSDQGIAESSEEDFLANGKLQLRPWGRIEGKLWKGDRPAVDASVACHVSSFSSLHPPINGSYETRTDANECFVLERIRPGTVQLFRQSVQVISGETTLFEWGKCGRSIEVPLVLSEEIQAFDLTHASFSLVGRVDLVGRELPRISLPNKRGLGWYDTWIQTEVGQAYRKTYDQIAAIEKRLKMA